MENPEEILHSLEEFAKLKPKDIPRELEDYLSFVAKTGDPVYQWSAVKSLFREKLINVITEFYESCPSVEIPPCPNVEMFNYDSMKNFILEKLDTFASAPFTVQRICELLTTPRKEYNRIDKYMRALEKNILVVSTTEPGNRRSTENGEGIVNGIETEHLTEANSSSDINVEEMDDSPSWPRLNQQEVNTFASVANSNIIETQPQATEVSQDTNEGIASCNESRIRIAEPSTSNNTDTVITCTPTEKAFVPIEPTITEDKLENNLNETVTATPAAVQKRRNSIEPITSDDNASSDSIESNKEDVTSEEPEIKSDITSPEEVEKLKFEDNISVTTDSDDIKENIDKKPADEEPITEKAELIENVEETSNLSENDAIATHSEIENSTSDPSPKDESVNEETCDTSQLIDNVENSVEKSSELPETTIIDEIPKINDTPIVESIEETAPSEVSAPILEETEEPLQEKTNETLIPSEPEEKGDSVDPVKEEALNETPMDIDTDENLLKESSIEASTVDAHSN